MVARDKSETKFNALGWVPVIPKTAHFIWFGQAFPWVHLLSLRSAAMRGGFDRIMLHHADDLSAAPYFREAQNIHGLVALKLDPESLLTECGSRGAELYSLYSQLTQPAAKANLIRLALLWQHGGIYLDLDTITVGSLSDCMEPGGAFCGVERIAFPATVRRSRNPAKMIQALSKSALRDLLRRVPKGFKGFKRVEHFYGEAANNAVFGAEAQHPLLGQMFEQALALPPKRQLARFALGTHLLQSAVARYRGEGLRVYPPRYFYPLAPEISEHWFRKTSNPDLSEVLDGETRVVHWYASVRTRQVVPQVDPQYVREHRDSQLFSALAAQFLEPELSNSLRD